MHNTESQALTEALPALADQAGISVFTDARMFEHAQRVAKMLALSKLVPQDYQGAANLPNCMIALEMAQRIGASPLMVMQNLYIVHGKPAWSSQFLIATLNASHRFSPLRYEESEKDGGATRAYATDKDSGEICYGPWVTMQMADKEGWVKKNGSKWQSMPELMRRYRAATFFVRQFAPEISMGIMTAEEVVDITPTGPTARSVAKQAVAEVQAPALSDAEREERNALIEQLDSAPDLEALGEMWRALPAAARKLVGAEYENSKTVVAAKAAS
jgi:hypothetical protein